MSKEDKERFIKVVDMFSKEGGSYTEDDIAQLTEYKMAGEIMLGRDEGIEIGINQEKMITAKNMLNKKYSLKEIIEITGLNEEEITKIKESM